MNLVADPHPTLEQLAAFDAGSLPPTERESVERHLAGCAACGRRVDGLPEDPFVALVRASASSAPTAGLAGPPVPEPDVPAELAGHPRYRVLERIGAGGMGTVYKAVHRLMDRVVALKVPHRAFLDRPGFAERFRREARAAARLSHPNIVLAHDAEQAGELPFLVMEFVPGTSLDRLVARRGPLPVAEACDGVRQAALGLHHAHEHGLVHRDVKPANLMRTPDGRVKVLDFGLAQLAREAGGGSSESPPGAVLGTPDYTAPEQARDPHAAGARADVYSLGCTLYFLLTGRPPFPESTVLAKLLAHQDRPAPSPSSSRDDVPAALSELVGRMLAKDPAGRPSAAEVARRLAPFAAPSDATPPWPLPPEPAAARTGWRGVWGVLAAVVLLAAGGLAVLLPRLLAPSRPPSPIVEAPEQGPPEENPAPPPPLATPEQLAIRKRERRKQALDWLRENAAEKHRAGMTRQAAQEIDRDFDRLDGFRLLVGGRLTLSGQAALLTANPGGLFVSPLTAAQARALNLEETRSRVLVCFAPPRPRRAVPRVRLSDLRIDHPDELALDRKVLGWVDYDVPGPAVPPPFAVCLTFYSDRGRRCSGLVWFKDRDLHGRGTLEFACPFPGGPENRPAGPFALFADVVTDREAPIVIESDAVAVLAAAPL